MILLFDIDRADFSLGSTLEMKVQTFDQYNFAPR